MTLKERRSAVVPARDSEFADDLLRGAAEIAEFLYGSRNFRRKIYHLVKHTRFPSFKLGSLICARKSVLLEWIEQQEERRGFFYVRKATNGELETVGT